VLLQRLFQARLRPPAQGLRHFVKALGQARGICAQIEARFERGGGVLIARILLQRLEHFRQTLVGDPGRRPCGSAPNAAQTLQGLARVARSLLAVLLEQAAHEAVQRRSGAIAGGHEGQWLGNFGEVTNEGIYGVRAAEGRFAAEQLVHQHAQRVHVSGGARGQTLKMLGRAGEQEIRRAAVLNAGGGPFEDGQPALDGAARRGEDDVEAVSLGLYLRAAELGDSGADELAVLVE